MTKAEQLLQRVDELFGFGTSNKDEYSPNENSLHRATHSLVHQAAIKRAGEHAGKFRLALQNKGLSKSYVNSLVSKTKSDAYNKHYRNLYTSTKREVEKEMHRDY